MVDTSDAFCGGCGTVIEARWAPPPIPPVPPRAPPSLPIPPLFPGAAPTSPGPAPAPYQAPYIPPARSLEALLGEAAPNTTYLGQRLLYEKTPEESFDPLTNNRYLAEVAKHAGMYAAFWFLGGYISFIFFLLFFALTRSLVPMILWAIAGLLAGLVFIAIFWFRPIPAMLSEWKFSVDGKGSVAPSAFEHITWSLRNRRTPIPSMRVRRITQPGVPDRDYLELRDNIFVGYVSCFPYGADLYVAWTFWLSLSPFRWILTAFGQVYHAMFFRVSDLYTALRYDTARAMREAIHSAAREGIDVAVGYMPAQGRGTIGSEVPVDVTAFTT